MNWYSSLIFLLGIQLRTILSQEYPDGYLDGILSQSRKEVEDNLSNPPPPRRSPNTRFYYAKNAPYVEELGRNSYIFDNAVDNLVTKSKCSRFDAEEALVRKDPNFNVLCNRRNFNCGPYTFSRYRTADGSCNNLRNPDYGMAIRRSERLLPPIYADGYNSPKRSVTGGELPNPRLVSITIHKNTPANDPTLTSMITGYGQITDHDITFTPNRDLDTCCDNPNQPDCNTIPVAADDPFYSQFNITCLEFMRSFRACGSRPRAQINQLTAFIDGSSIYGSSQEHQNELRSFQFGQLKSQRNGAILPADPEAKMCLARRNHLCFKAGDDRVNENPFLTSMHTMFMREHNRIARGLSLENPSWNDETLFQEARRIVGAQLQQFSYNEHVPLLIGPKLMRQFRIALPPGAGTTVYNSAVNPSIVSSFVIAYRLHNFLINEINLLTRTSPLMFNFQNPDLPYVPGNVEKILTGLTRQPAQKFDNLISEALTGHLFQRPNESYGGDLIALNLQRGRDHGLPGYLAFRRFCGLPTSRTFEGLSKFFSNDQIATQYSQLYRSVEDIDLWTGGNSERPIAGGTVGPTIACIIGHQFQRLMHGDRYFFTHRGNFSPAQLANLRSRRLADVLCDNGGLTYVQNDVFHQASASNPLRRCGSCTLNLSLWKERKSSIKYER